LGATAHALAGLVAREIGQNATIAHYRGESAQLPDILGGRLHGGFQSTVLTPQLVRAGQVRALAASGEQRLSSLPEVPTFVEQGYSRSFSFVGFSGLFAPARTPVAALARLRDAFRRVATARATREWLISLGITPGHQDGPDFRAQIASDMRDWQAMVEELGITGEG
jgi:tripartite-type tricarboxylate transporter receptor subunit TctC